MASTTDFSEASLNTLQLALRTMKERCRGQEARIGELEDDNAHLRADRANLYTEMNKLQEANILLREKNLQLNQQLHTKSRENADVREQFDSLQEQHSDKVRQLQRLQSEVTSIALNDDGIQDMGGESLEDSAREMGELKGKLLQQQAAMREALSVMAAAFRRQLRQRQSEAQAAPRPSSPPAAMSMSSLTESATSASQAASASASARTCPMCEVAFPLTETSQDDFEAHVVDHFRYEESDTLKGFDFVYDAHGNHFDP